MGSVMMMRSLFVERSRGVVRHWIRARRRRWWRVITVLHRSVSPGSGAMKVRMRRRRSTMTIWCTHGTRTYGVRMAKDVLIRPRSGF